MIDPSHAVGINWTTVVEVVSSIVGLGAFVWGVIKTYQAWVNSRTRKRESEEDAEIQKKIQAVVDTSVTKMLTRVDDIVHTSVADQLAILDKKIEEVHNETHNNGGSSMKDAQDRMEASLARLLTGQDVQRAILKNQDEKIGEISETLEKRGADITDLKIAMASHIGAHLGLPEKGDQGQRGETGSPGASADEVSKLRAQVGHLQEGQTALLNDMAVNGGDTSSSRDVLKRIEARLDTD